MELVTCKQTSSRIFSPQPQDPHRAVVAEAPPSDEDTGQVQDQLRHVRLGPAGAREPGATQGQQHLGDHLSRPGERPAETSHADLTTAG